MMSSEIVVLQYPSRNTHEAARTAARAMLSTLDPATACVLRPAVLARVAGKVRAVQTLVLTQHSSATGWAGIAIHCVVLVDTFEAVVPVDVSALPAFLRRILALDDLFAFRSFFLFFLVTRLSVDVCWNAAAQRVLCLQRRRFLTASRRRQTVRR